MKNIKILLAICLFTAGTVLAEEISAADKRWSKAVETKIAQGAATVTTVSTPSESRAKLAKALADKLGRKSEIKKTDKGFHIVVEAATSAGQTASK